MEPPFKKRIKIGMDIPFNTKRINIGMDLPFNTKRINPWNGV
jgi:hypothetical protein